MERTADDLWAVGDSDVTQPETTLIEATATTIFHMAIASTGWTATVTPAWLTDGKKPFRQMPGRIDLRAAGTTQHFGSDIVDVAIVHPSLQKVAPQNPMPTINTNCRPHQ